MAKISYSPATAADVSSVRTLLVDCALPADDIHKHVEHFVVAKDGNDLVGVIGLELLGSAALLRSFAVARQHRRRGVGKELYKRVLAYAQLRDVSALYLLTSTAVDYFSRLGFRLVARAEVPAEVRGTEEFRNLCPSTATCLTKRIGGDADTLEDS
jgi:amino-acid N-acetyltransferase